MSATPQSNRDGQGFAKFEHAEITAKGEPRARVRLENLETLWINTGTLCNIECANCYIESSPTNDRLQFVTCEDVLPFLDEIRDHGLGTREIGLTGGEPFVNPHVVEIIELCLERGFDLLVLTNAMRPLMRPKVREPLLVLNRSHPGRITMRVSLDHFTQERHEQERGAGSWDPALEGLRWLADAGFTVHIAGRTCWDESEAQARCGYGELLERLKIEIDPHDPAQLVLFPEMNDSDDVPEISEGCWSILGKSPQDVMCASSRMVVKRKGQTPCVLACTLLPYSSDFELGQTLAESSHDVWLNHRHCSTFCVLGGASCSAKDA